MSHFGYYPAEKFLSMELKPREWLVEGLIRENDAVVLVGNEKSGKSLFIFQLICALTSQQPFLDTYQIPKPIKITYLHLEGELEDSQNRLKRMQKVLELDKALFQYAFLPPLELQSHAAVQSVRKRIEEFHKPDIVIIDPLYFSFQGRLSDDEVVRHFIGEMRLLKDYFNCAMILVHHTHKQRFDYTGSKIVEGDEAIFGSKFLKAWADHTLLLDYDKDKNVRILSCSTQRSGDILKECTLRLIEPDPLYFELLKKDPTRNEEIVTLLMKHEYAQGLSKEKICEILKISHYSFYKSIKEPLARGEIVKGEDKRPVPYMYNWAKKR